MSEQGNIPIAEDLRACYEATKEVLDSRVYGGTAKRIRGLIERCSRAEAEVAQLKAGRTRMMDLIRHQRNELYDEGLIDEKEFAALVADSDSGQRVARLETYDTLKAENLRLKAPVSDEEWAKHGSTYDGLHICGRIDVDALLTARTQGGSNDK